MATKTTRRLANRKVMRHAKSRGKKPSKTSRVKEPKTVKELDEMAEGAFGDTPI